MKHYVLLGLNPTNKEYSKIAFHIPLEDDSSFLKYQEIINKVEKLVLNPRTFSIYFLDASDTTWKTLIKENPYFSSIKKPISSIDKFIEILNNFNLTSIDIAEYILKIEHCTHLRLQKLLYLVYAQYYKKYRKKLFSENFFAWKYGPVNKEVYKYIKFNNNVFESTNEIMNEEPDNIQEHEFHKLANVFLSPNYKEISALIHDVIDQYKDVTTNDLVKLLHHDSESAWSKTKQNEIIKDEDILNSKY